MGGTLGGRDIAKIEKKYHREHEQLRQHIDQLTKLILRSGRLQKGTSRTNLNMPTTYVPKIGDRVSHKGYAATVKFIGILPNLADLWIGIDLDERVGKNDGNHKTVQYFQCEKKHGLFVKPSQIIKIADTSAGLDTMALPVPGRNTNQRDSDSRDGRRRSSTYYALPPNLYMRSESNYYSSTDTGPSEQENKDVNFEVEIPKLEKRLHHEKNRYAQYVTRRKQQNLISTENQATLSEWELFYESFQNRMPGIIHNLALLREMKGLSDTEGDALHHVIANFKSVAASDKQDAISLPALSRQTSENVEKEDMPFFEDPSGSKFVIHEKAPAPLP